MAKKSQRLRRQRRIERMKTLEQEAKITKVVEDNSVVLERMKHASSTCDKVLQKLENIKKEPEASAQVIEPQFVSNEPAPELEGEKVEKAASAIKVVPKEPAKPKVKPKAKTTRKRTTTRRRATTKKKTSEE